MGLSAMLHWGLLGAVACKGPTVWQTSPPPGPPSLEHLVLELDSPGSARGAAMALAQRPGGVERLETAFLEPGRARCEAGAALLSLPGDVERRSRLRQRLLQQDALSCAPLLAVEAPGAFLELLSLAPPGPPGDGENGLLTCSAGRAWVQATLASGGAPTSTLFSSVLPHWSPPCALDMQDAWGLAFRDPTLRPSIAAMALASGPSATNFWEGALAGPDPESPPVDTHTPPIAGGARAPDCALVDGWIVLSLMGLNPGGSDLSLLSRALMAQPECPTLEGSPLRESIARGGIIRATREESHTAAEVLLRLGWQPHTPSQQDELDLVRQHPGTLVPLDPHRVQVLGYVLAHWDLSAGERQDLHTILVDADSELLPQVAAVIPSISDPAVRLRLLRRALPAPGEAVDPTQAVGWVTAEIFRPDVDTAHARACGDMLKRLGPSAIPPLVARFRETTDPGARSRLLATLEGLDPDGGATVALLEEILWSDEHGPLSAYAADRLPRVQYAAASKWVGGFLCAPGFDTLHETALLAMLSVRRTQTRTFLKDSIARCGDLEALATLSRSLPRLDAGYEGFLAAQHGLDTLMAGTLQGPLQAGAYQQDTELWTRIKVFIELRSQVVTSILMRACDMSVNTSPEVRRAALTDLRRIHKTWNLADSGAAERLLAAAPGVTDPSIRQEMESTARLLSSRP